MRRWARGVALGWIAEGLYGAAGSSVDLTTVWGINAAFEHGWTPSLKTSFYATYASVEYDLAAATMARIAVPVAGGSGNPDLSIWLVGSRTQWTPVKGLIMGVDVYYQRLQTAFAGGVTTAASGARTAGYPVSDQGIWEFAFRIQRNILP